MVCLGGGLKPSWKARKGIIKELLEDLDPRVRKYVKRLINNYYGEDDKLKELMDLKKTMKSIELREYPNGRGFYLRCGNPYPF